MSTDPFEQAFVDWLRGVRIDAKARREDANMAALVWALQQQGHRITFDETYHYLYVNADSSQPLTITVENTREMQPETLLQWVKERMQ